MSAIKRILKDQMGFITSPEQLEEVANEERLRPVLVRCGGGRFICPAQNAAHFVSILEKSDDYVRDMSIMSAG